MNDHIDAVITWVGGSDRNHQNKMSPILSNYKERPDSAHPTRFSDNGEIYFCVKSILKFTPWVRHIYIVTDAPPVIPPPFYKQLNDPKLINKISIVDHKEIFEGFEQYLPVFNSLSIEAMLWRIKGLSDNFIYFNDDTMMIRPLLATDFISKNNYTLRGCLIKKRNQKFLHKLRLKLKTPRANSVSHRDTQEKSSDATVSTSLYLDLPHNPVMLIRSFFSDFFENHLLLLKQTISHRFHHQEQLWAVSLFTYYVLSKNTGNIDNTYKQPISKLTTTLSPALRK